MAEVRWRAPRIRRRWFVLLVLVLAVAAALAWRQRAETAFTRTTAEVAAADGTELQTTTWVPDGVDADSPAPAVLVAQGLGETQQDVRGMVRALVRDGYVVRTWTSRGVDDAPGRVGIAAPDGEVADVSSLVDDLAERDDVVQDADGDPRVAVVGVSHGGGVAVLAGAADDRIDALVPIFAWYSLRRALEPDGVLKLRWASELFAAGSGTRRRAAPCGNLEEELCRAWTASARAGRLTPAALDLLAERSPATVARGMTAPTLIVQGQMDSLFGLDEAVDLAHALRDAKVPARVEWVRAGHDLPLDRRRLEHVEGATLRWLDRYLRKRGDVDVGPRFTVELGAGRGYANTERIPPRATLRRLDLVPDASGDEGDGGRQQVDANGRVRYAAPPAGLPADVTTLPGFGDISGVDQGFAPPAGQRARLTSEPVEDGVEIIGSGLVRLQLTADVPDGIAFVRLVDVAPGGQELVPRGLVAPVRLTGLPPLGSKRGLEVDVRLPAIAWRLAPGHRLAVDVSSTDAGYVAPARPAVFAVGPTAGGGASLLVPEVDSPRRSDETFDAGPDWRDLLAAAAVLLLAAVATGLALAARVRSRDARVQEPQLRDVPISASGLVKRFEAGRVAVAGATFEVRPGTVVGLVGPNGAGKTTILRMLLGLIHPTDGAAHAFGQRVRPGIPNLARVGALVEGPGLAPHLSGRDHLRRYWSATGRPAADAGIDRALEQVGLTADAARPVRTWSHGMRQRLGIAQALLGSPDLVLLDEPTNGLDPAQIHQLRTLVQQLAADGCAVLLSSHLLGELERVCTHVVLVAEGRVLATGTLAEVVGDHPDLEAAFLHRMGLHGADDGDQSEEEGSDA